MERFQEGVSLKRALKKEVNLRRKDAALWPVEKKIITTSKDVAQFIEDEARVPYDLRKNNCRNLVKKFISKFMSEWTDIEYFELKLSSNNTKRKPLPT